MTTQQLPLLAIADAIWSRGHWTLVAPLCGYCAGRHTFGGGDDPRTPGFGARITHCASQHRAFRGECDAQPTPGGRRMCSIRHGGSAYELIPLPTMTVVIKAS
jgi:hypothetical protein